MNNEEAYKLGEFNFSRKFYSSVLWKINKEPFELYKYFNWSINTSTSNDWENIYAYGSLRKESFTTIENKLNYVRGALKGAKINEDGFISLVWANSYDLRDILCEFIHEIIISKFFCTNKNLIQYPNFSMIKREITFTIPGTPILEIYGEKEILNYLIGKE